MRIIFHVGLHKTATTWLQSVLFKQHPEIHLINDYQEPWNDEIVRYLVLNDRFSFDPEVFQSLVQERIESDGFPGNGVYLVSAERLSGHPMSGGFDRERIIRNIHSSYPDAQILVTIRNQLDLIRSTYQQLIREGDTRRVSEFLGQEFWKRPFFDFNYYDFEVLYTLYGELFPQKKLGFFCFEDLVENKKKYIQDLCGFFGVKDFFPNDKEKVNASVGKKELEAIRFLNHFRKTEYTPSPLFDLKGSLVYSVLIKLLKVFFIKTSSDFSEEDRLRIKSHYSRSNYLFLSRLENGRCKDPRYVVDA